MSFVAPQLQLSVELLMGGRWNTFGFQFICLMILILSSGLKGCSSINVDGLHLLKFRARVFNDPYNALANWNPEDHNPCMWLGVHCDDGKVQMVDLSGLSLGGMLAPDLADLSDLRVLVLQRNSFSGTIPIEFGKLTKLELLDLRSNCLSGKVPVEVGKMKSLERLLLCDNKFEGNIPSELGKLSFLYELQFDQNLAADHISDIGHVNRKFGHGSQFPAQSHIALGDHISGDLNVQSSFYPSMVQIASNVLDSSSHRRLLEDLSNLEAEAPKAVSPSAAVISLPTSVSSGSFPAVSNWKNQSHPLPTPVAAPSDSTKSTDTALSSAGHGSSSLQVWMYVAIALGVVLLLAIIAAVYYICRSQAAKTGPFKTGISGQLQKAFVTGVPKLNRAELETACEDFSNIIDIIDGCTMYKGTLSSGVEIAVASTAVKSAKDWSEESELAYRKKIETLSRVNHKNFVNLIGYCEEDEPFSRMMVFEYAPNGTLFEHLHVKEFEHLDWGARVRIIMGTAYCLQYMHELNPPVAHPNLTSSRIYLTDDYAAKIAEILFPNEKSEPKSSNENKPQITASTVPADPRSNVYSFGIMLLEIISGKLSYSEHEGSLIDWASEHLNDRRNFGYMADPTLKSFKNNEFNVICEMIKDCINPDPSERPAMRDVISRLKQSIPIEPDSAVPRLSPLWWAELEILSAEAA